MTAAELRACSECPAGISVCARAMWVLAQGGWDEAHRLVQDEDGPDAAWVHAHLHRAEGDLGNASYWYARARQPVCQAPLDQEWESLTEALLRSC